MSKTLQAGMFGLLPGRNNLWQLFDHWRDDTFDVFRNRGSRIVGILIVAFVLTRLWKVASRHLSELSGRPRLTVRRAHPADAHAFQRDLPVGVFVILFLAAMQILSQVNINVGPRLASAGMASLGFHQSICHPS